MVYDLVSDTDAESSDALVPMVRPTSRKEEHDFPNRTTDGDMLSKAVETLRCQVTNTTNKLYAEQGLDSSRAFLSTLSALCTLPTEDLARLCTGIHHASTSFYPNTSSASDAGSPSTNSSKKGKTLVKGTHCRVHCWPFNCNAIAFLSETISATCARELQNINSSLLLIRRADNLRIRY